MGKKIIFVGPPEAGKTTLRKIFFEGENRKELLEFGLEPTHGNENILLNLSETVGVFDLAGQENQRWLETDERSIFFDSEIIIIVLDISSSEEEIIEFIQKVVKIRKEITPSSFIYILLHKKDLITKEKLAELKLEIITELRGVSQMKLAFTSIVKENFLDTLSLFMDILKTCTSKQLYTEKINLDLLKNAIDLIYYIQQEIVISKTNLIEKLKISDQKISYILETLKSEQYIKSTETHNISLYSLTDKGKNYFEKVLKDFSIDRFTFETNYFETDLKRKLIPPFLGFMVADKDGKTLITIEVYDGIFGEVLKPEGGEMQPDHELIPMFICALEKFSTEINIQNLSGFHLKGTNIMMETFRFELVTITVFMNADTNINSVREQVSAWFTQFFKKNEKEFQHSIITGEVTKLNELNEIGGKWLNELNQNYKKMAINLDIYDFRQATDLYEKIEAMTKERNINHSMLIQKIKTIKNDLLNAMYNENFGEIRKLAKIASNLKI